ncbi:MAG TPA: thiol:disulfide interchange protein DsbA/DsbL [Burkholderiaceae bacterium]|nr:thiol:disulfide interchange protein DsbA/DsbL [Burkholderiaceae bacterium]
MKRRQFSIALVGAGAAALTLPTATSAQSSPIDGRNYVRLSTPVPVAAPPGKFEVIEFFWYGCPHCAAFEPVLESWVKQLPEDVAFRRVPVAFRAEPYAAHQRLFYALDSLGLVPALQRKVFYAIHVERQRLDNPGEISAFATKNGIDAAKLLEAYSSFGTQAKLKQANQLVDGYKIDGVPALGIQGRFYTSGTLAGDNERALAVTDFLLQRLRKPG